MMAPRSLALVLLALLASGASAGACTSGTTPNCSPDATGADACGIAFEAGDGTTGEASGDDSSSPESGSGGDTGAAPGDAAPETGGQSDSGSGSGDSAPAPGEGGEGGD